MQAIAPSPATSHHLSRPLTRRLGGATAAHAHCSAVTVVALPGPCMGPIGVSGCASGDSAGSLDCYTAFAEAVAGLPVRAARSAASLDALPTPCQLTLPPHKAFALPMTAMAPAHSCTSEQRIRNCHVTEIPCSGNTSRKIK